MNIWDILDLDKTQRIDVIRDAFVQNFCAVKPEYFSEDGFLILREAYLRTIHYARSGMSKGDDIDIDDHNLVLSQEEIEYLRQIDKVRKDAAGESKNVVIPHEVTALFDDIIYFLASMMALHIDFYGRIEVESWRSLLQSDLIAVPSVVNYLRLPVLKACCANPLIPHNVWIYLDLVFHWTDKTYSLPSKFEKEKQILLIETDSKWSMSYSLFQPPRLSRLTSFGMESSYVFARPGQSKAAHHDPSTGPDFELYATYRMKARNAIIEGDEKEAEHCFIKAYEIYDQDPDLFAIYFEYFQSIEDEKKLIALKDLHLLVLDRLLGFYPNHFMFMLCRTQVNALSQPAASAINEYKRLMAKFPESLVILYHLAELYRRMNQDSAARKCIKQIEKMYPSVQKKLLDGKGFSRDSAAINEQMRLNEQVMNIINRDKNQSKKPLLGFRKKEESIS